MLNIVASATPQELLAGDAELPEMRLAEHPIWQAAFDGRLPKKKLKRLVLALAPVVAGPGRYAFGAKVSQIAAADGKVLFMDLYNALKDPRANSDEGWAIIAKAVGCSERELAAALAAPSAEAMDYLDVLREHGLKSSPVEAALIAWAVEQHLPGIWERLADALVAHYGVDESAVDFLRYQAERGESVRKWVQHLVETYVYQAEPYKVFEGRRAAREAVWAWTVLTESI